MNVSSLHSLHCIVNCILSSLPHLPQQPRASLFTSTDDEDTVVLASLFLSCVAVVPDTWLHVEHVHHFPVQTKTVVSTKQLIITQLVLTVFI